MAPCPSCGASAGDAHLESCPHRVIEADFVPNEQLDGPIKPPMTAKEFKRHCAKLAADKSKGMATRLAAFGLGALTELVSDGISEVLGSPPKKKRLKK